MKTTASLLIAALALPAYAQQTLKTTERISFEPTYTQIASGKWTGKRLPDGQPDVEGHWSNTVGNHNNWTDPQGGIPGDPAPPRKPLGPRGRQAASPIRWTGKYRSSRGPKPRRKTS
jgi:hypothetical protein